MKLVVTDYGEGDHTDFILSVRAYSKLALPNMAVELFAYGVVDIEYKRISCQHPGYNLMFKVHEHSRNPEYLAVVPIYQAGINDITYVELWQVIPLKILSKSAFLIKLICFLTLTFVNGCRRIARNGGPCVMLTALYGTCLIHQRAL